VQKIITRSDVVAAALRIAKEHAKEARKAGSDHRADQLLNERSALLDVARRHGA
jgi:hypothetical protein